MTRKRIKFASWNGEIEEVVKEKRKGN